MIVEPFRFVLVADAYVASWYVYGMWLDNRLRYIGVADARNLMVLPDATNNPIVNKAMKAHAVVPIEVYSSHRSQADARAAASALISKHRPDLNQYGMASRSKRKAVVCVENGLQFRSVSAAAQFAGVSLATMSNHLYRRRGYHHINNMHYDFALTTEHPSNDHASPAHRA